MNDTIDSLLCFFPYLPTIFGASEVKIVWGQYELQATNLEHQKIVQAYAKRHHL